MSYVTCHMSHVTCHMSRVTCHMLYVTCHLSPVTCHMSHFFLNGEALWWRVSYQQGRPGLVLFRDQEERGALGEKYINEKGGDAQPSAPNAAAH